MVNTNTKKSLGIFFLLTGLLPWLFIIAFYIHEHVIRHRMKEQLEQTLTRHTVSIPDHEIQWEEKGREIWVNGRLFDIEKSTRHNGITIFTGLFDEQETALKKQVKDNLQQNNGNDNKLLTQLITSFQQLFFEETNPCEVIFTNDSIITAALVKRLPFPFSDIPTPPPQC